MKVKEELKWILNHLNVDELDDEQANALISVIYLKIVSFLRKKN